MNTSTEIGLADLLRAYDRLRPDAETLALVARCLGYSTGDPNPSEATRGISQEQQARGGERPEGETLPIPPEAASSAEASSSPPPARQHLKTRILRMEPSATSEQRVSVPSQILNAPPLPERRVAPPRASLFHARTAPRLLSAALSTRRPGPVFDLEAILRTLISGRPLRRVPRQPIPTLEHGVQLLLDYSDAMAPFRLDLADLARQLEDLFGPDQLEIYRFDRDPRTAAKGPWPDSPCWSPRKGRPVAIATDFGRSIPDRTQDSGLLRFWGEFIARCNEADCPVIVFNPLGRDFWPRNLSRRLTLIHWSTTTRAIAIRQLVGPGHKLREIQDPLAPAYLTEALRLRPHRQENTPKGDQLGIQWEADD